MRLLALLLLLGCEKEKPVPPLGAGPIPCTVEAQVLQRKEAAVLVKAGKLQAAHELLSRQSCGASDEQSMDLIEQIAWVDVARADVLYQLGDFYWCERSTVPNTMPDGDLSKYFPPEHPVSKAFVELAAPCEAALAKERARFTESTWCQAADLDLRRVRGYALPDQSCLALEECGDSHLIRGNEKTKLTVSGGNLIGPGCNHLGRVSVAGNELIVEAGGRDYRHLWWPYSRHLYKLDGATLTFVREIRTPADLEAR